MNNYSNKTIYVTAWRPFCTVFFLLFLSGLVAGVASMMAWAGTTKAGKVIGKGDNITITQEEIEFFKKNFVPKYIVPTEKALLDVFLRQRLFSREALEKGYNQEPDVKMRLEMERERVLGRVYGERYLKEHLNITDEVLRSYYLSHIQEFTLPRRLELYKIVTRDKEAAEKAYQKAKALPDAFPDLARKSSVDPRTQPEGGKMGLVREDALVPKIRKCLEGAGKNTVVGPIELKGFYYVFWVKDVQPKEVTPFKKIKEELYRKIAREKASKVLDKHLGELEAKYHFKWIKK